MTQQRWWLMRKEEERWWWTASNRSNLCARARLDIKHWQIKYPIVWWCVINDAMLSIEHVVEVKVSCELALWGVRVVLCELVVFVEACCKNTKNVAGQKWRFGSKVKRVSVGTQYTANTSPNITQQSKTGGNAKPLKVSNAAADSQKQRVAINTNGSNEFINNSDCQRNI